MGNMQKKYIDAEKIHDVIASHFCACSDETEAALHSVWDKLTAILGEDVAEIRRGKWIPGKETLSPQKRGYICSKCREPTLKAYMGNPARTNYCPNCGALMEATQ